MTREDFIARFKFLKGQNLPKVTAEYVLKDLKDYTPEQIQDLNDYFVAFAEPTATDGGRKCLWCEKTLCISWGLAHGSAYCTSCGSQVEVYHYPKFSDGKKHDRISIALQYHPDCFEEEDDEYVEDDEE